MWSRLPALLLNFSRILLGNNPSIPLTSLDPHNQSWVQNWASIGDSYAAGLGVGNRLDYSCSRYDGGYPVLISIDDRFGAHPNRTSQFLSCSGLKSSEILKNQVPYLASNLDVLLLSAGGNDVHLGDVLDSCIFQFRRGDSVACETALNNSQALIDGELAGNLDTLLSAVVGNLAKNGTIYYPRYAQFFGESTACDNVTWTVWPRMAEKDKQRLTADRRIRMNDMVRQVNQKLKEAAERAGPQVVFIDWDWTFRQAQGRFCEDQVVEPAPDRPGLLFYEWNTMEDGENRRIIERPGDPVPKDTFEGSIGSWVMETWLEHPDWEFGPEGTGPIILDDEVKRWIGEHWDEVKIDMGLDDLIFWFLPDSWKRVFHPRAMGHRIIADMILHEMAVKRAKMLGMETPQAPNFWVN